MTTSTDARLAFAQASAFHPNPLSAITYFEKYSRWRDDLGRRETWPETVQRAMDFLRELSENKLSEEDYQEMHEAILKMEVLPSMRLLAMAGPAARRNNIVLYNCGYTPVDSLDAFVEALIISMSGTGLGYSVEEHFVKQLPVIIPQTGYKLGVHVVDDSAEGWANALQIGLTAWFGGYDIDFDTSLLRPAGAILKTKGGRSSGPKPLENMLAFARQRILSKQGRQFSSLDCHDIMGNIALGAVSGGHRRSAMIALYSWNDLEMRHCKDGKFWEHSPWRTTANNSAVLVDPNMDANEIRAHIGAMLASGTGEPGLFSRAAARELRPLRRSDAEFGTNPCAEISLRAQEFCNLTEVVLRPTDMLDEILRKTRIATIIGTIQATATYFPGLRPQWAANCEEERLLGVGFTGQMDCPGFWNTFTMIQVRTMAKNYNKYYAGVLGINPAAAVTCVKPSGSTSLLTNASSGLHTRWAPYYERNVRVMATGPVAKTLLTNMVPMSPEIGQEWGTADTYVAHFPMKSPDGAITRQDRSALEQLEYWKLCKLYLTEHNPSVTITYKPAERESVEAWMVENRGILGGVAVLPHWEEDITLPLMPHREMTEEEYREKIAAFPDIDYSLITEYESSDQTTAAQEVACSSGLCEV